MSPEPAELQILKQILGDERGTYVFATYTMAASLAQQAQQVAEQAQRIEQMQGQAVPAEPMTNGANPWTDTTLEMVGSAPLEAP